MVKPTAETVGHLLSLSFGEAASSAFESIKTFRATKETLEQKVWTLWRESLAIALPEFFETAGLIRRPDDKELARLLVEILDGAERLCKRKDVQLTATDLKHPLGLELYKDVREKLPGWAREIAPQHLRDDDHLRRRLDRAFVKGFHRARFEGGSHFDHIRDYLLGDGAEAIERRDHWLRYYEWLRAEVQDAPMFGQEAGGPSLADIFVPLRCTCVGATARASWTRGSGRRQAGRRCMSAGFWKSCGPGWTRRTRRTCCAWSRVGRAAASRARPRYFHADVALADQYNVFLVPLQGLNVNQDIDAVVSDYLDDARHNSSCLPESPIDWIRHDPKPLLLIFDGLDEVAREDGAGLEVTRTFLESLRVWLGRVNGGGADLKVMALTLGRPQAAEEAASKIRRARRSLPSLCRTALHVG